MPAPSAGPSRFERTAQQFLFHRSQETASKAIREQSRNWLKKYMQSGEAEVYADGNGNINLEFPSPLTIDGKTYRGLQLRRTQGTATLDEEVAIDYLMERGFDDRALYYTAHVDQDELAALNQEGEISDEDLDDMFVTPEPSWSLWALEA